MINMNFTKMSLVLLAVAVLLTGVAVTQAETIGYWRFEDASGLLEDSSTYDNDLTSHGSPTHVTLASAGSAIDNPIPQTGAANLKAVDLCGAGGDGTGDYYSIADQPEFDVYDFTIESYVRIDDLGLHMIAAQHASQTANRTWYFDYEDGGVRLRVQTSSGGVGYYGAPLTVDHEYYLAASYDGDGTTGGVKFYIKDLTARTGLVTYSRNKTLTASLTNSTCDLMVGGYAAAAGSYTWDGLIDEVRFSNTVLTEKQLLVSVPEPGSIAMLLGLGFASFLAFTRRGKRRG